MKVQGTSRAQSLIAPSRMVLSACNQFEHGGSKQ